MKSFIVLALCVAVAVAVPLDSSKDATIIQQTLDNIGVGDYSYSSQTSDGKTAQEQGTLTNVGTDDEAIAVRGSYSYTDPASGQTFTVEYNAGVGGFVAVGDHIPKPQ